ncbi:MAG TPA: hypothetical protein VNZ22_05415 [Bacillota bacterium]|nr:hypothetical protein [Bacillota bacterium]
MRALGQPKVLKSAALAALFTAALCYPRLALAPQRLLPVWYLEAVLLLGGTFLWGFVFAWHTRYTARPVFVWKPEPVLFGWVTCLGIVGTLLLYLFLDPALRGKIPEDYPRTGQQWLATTLFSLAFTQLFVVFAPYAWLVRLFQRPVLAGLLTVVFGVVVLGIKHHSSPVPVSSWLLSGLLVTRVVAGLLSVYFFLRGGVVLVWWWGLLLQSRHLLQLWHGT